MQQYIFVNMTKQEIVKYVHIKNKTVYVNGVEDFTIEEEKFSALAKRIYANYGIKYSKYFKMDSLCKLGFLASEVLLQRMELSKFKPEEFALIYANSSASLHNDNRYQQTIIDIPSPSVFVYTLANIVIGETCIRNNFKGESTFFVQDVFDPKFMTNYVNSIFMTTPTKVCIIGWLEMSIDNSYEAFLCFVQQGYELMDFNEINLSSIYHK